MNKASWAYLRTRSLRRLLPSSFFLLPLLSLFLYLSVSYAGGFLGFPLDDAWIHQTYARNLGTLGQFAFIPGRPSAGSTSPLWSGLLALGYLFKIDYRVWTYALGAVLHSLNAWLAYRLVLALWPERKWAALLAGVFVALEWHLAWAAASGMETLLFSAFALAAFVIPPRRAAWLGVCVGLSVLARPDGLTLLPFTLARVFWFAYVSLFSPTYPSGVPTAEGGQPTLSGAPPFSLGRGWGERGRKAFGLMRLLLAHLLGFAVLFLPYLTLNRWLGGSFWPNTFYAKAAEYAVLRGQPLLIRLGWVGLRPLVGAQALLLPGLATAIWRWVGQRRWGALLPLGWVGAFVVAYAVRLPVTYQHGRYLIPLIPVLVALGLGGTSTMLRLSAAELCSVPRILSRAWAAAIGLLLMVFCVLGAGAYTRDVQIIETEMVQTARWVNQNTPSNALIAAHDIGALGYFGGREMLDMAGLVSPEVIPFIRDEGRLRAWLSASGADYLVTFPGWYPELVRPLAAAEVYRTEAPYSPVAGGENLAVYRWPAGQQSLP